MEAVAAELRAAMATLDPPAAVRRPGDVAAAFRRLLPRLATEPAPDPSALPFRFDPALGAAETGRAIAAAHRRMARTGRPSLPGLLAAAYDGIGMAPEAPERRAAMVAAVLAAATPAPRFHDLRHTREVVANAIWLAAATPRLSAGERALLFLAATVHDLGHDGGTNARAGADGRRRTIPCLLEDRSLGLILPVARRAGLAPARIAALVAMVRQTDIARRAGLTALHDAVLGEGASPARATGPEDDPERLRARPRVLLATAVLADADVLTSAGLTRASQRVQDARLAAERGTAVDPAVGLRFFDRLLGGRFITAAGRRLDPNLRRLRAALAAAGSESRALTSPDA